MVISLRLHRPNRDSCIMGKNDATAFQNATRRHSTLALIHTDSKGLASGAMQGHSYWQAFVDDASRFWVVAF